MIVYILYSDGWDHGSTINWGFCLDERKAERWVQLVKDAKNNKELKLLGINHNGYAGNPYYEELWDMDDLV